MAGLFLLVFTALIPTSSGFAQVSISDIAAWPNERTSDNQPGLAIDNDIGTYTWATAAFNQGVNHLGIGFGAATDVHGLRMWKDDNGGGGANYKNLLILWTDSATSVPLTERNWQPAPNLVNGINGSELMVADSVNLNGSVVNDVHDSVNSGHGWASLSFDPVAATGLAVQFSGSSFNHYKVHEIRAIPEPGGLSLTLLGLAFAAVARSHRSQTGSGPE